MRTRFILVLCSAGWIYSSAADIIPDEYRRADARRFVLNDYCKRDCAGYLDTHSPRYRRIMARALNGNFKALRQVFFERDFHSGDNESWEGIPGQILYVVSDERFARFLSQLSPEYQRQALLYINNAGFFHAAAERGDGTFFRRHFPLTHHYYATFWPQFADNGLFRPRVRLQKAPSS